MNGTRMEEYTILVYRCLGKVFLGGAIAGVIGGVTGVVIGIESSPPEKLLFMTTTPLAASIGAIVGALLWAMRTQSTAERFRRSLVAMFIVALIVGLSCFFNIGTVGLHKEQPQQPG